MTPKQDRFCREYLIDLNATQAAIRAGYSPKGAEVQGHVLLRNPKIADRISELRKEQDRRLNRDADEVIRRLWQIVEADITDAFDEDGLPLLPKKFPAKLRAALSSIKLGDTFEIKANDRLKALELLGKYHALFTDKTQVDVKAQGQVVLYLPDDGREQPAAD